MYDLAFNQFKEMSFEQIVAEMSAAERGVTEQLVADLAADFHKFNNDMYTALLDAAKLVSASYDLTQHSCLFDVVVRLLRHAPSCRRLPTKVLCLTHNMLWCRISGSSFPATPSLLQIYPALDNYYRKLNELTEAAGGAADIGGVIDLNGLFDYYKDYYAQLESLAMLLRQPQLRNVPDALSLVYADTDSCRFVLNTLIGQALYSDSV
jgi:hypothetical protein